MNGRVTGFDWVTNELETTAITHAINTETATTFIRLQNKALLYFSKVSANRIHSGSQLDPASIHINIWQRIYKCSLSSETYNHFFGLSRIDTNVIITRPLLNNVSRILDNRYHVLVAYLKYSAVVNILINRTRRLQLIDMD